MLFERAAKETVGSECHVTATPTTRVAGRRERRQRSLCLDERHPPTHVGRDVGHFGTKPYWSLPATLILADGTWTCDITTGGVDERATEIVAFLVPKTF